MYLLTDFKTVRYYTARHPTYRSDAIYNDIVLTGKQNKKNIKIKI